MNRHRIPDPPVQLAASPEQALRWIAYQRPPLDAKYERLLQYESVLDRAYYCGAGVYAPADSPKVQQAYRDLVRALATGGLTAKGIPHEQKEPEVSVPADDDADEILPTRRSTDLDDGIIDEYTESLGLLEDIPASVWLEKELVWAYPGSFCEYIIDGCKKYKKIHIPLEDLAKIFPAPGDDHDLVAAAGGEQRGRWVPAVPGVRHTNKPLAVLDILRADIEAAADRGKRPVTQEWVVERAMKMGLTQTRGRAVARVLVAKE